MVIVRECVCSCSRDDIYKRDDETSSNSCFVNNVNLCLKTKTERGE